MLYMPREKGQRVGRVRLDPCSSCSRCYRDPRSTQATIGNIFSNLDETM